MEALFGHPILQSLLAGILSWISVSLGASAIFLRREFSRLAMDCMLGAAGGMMLGAAFLGLLQPAAEMASHMGRLHFIPIVCGLMAGTPSSWALTISCPICTSARSSRRAFPPAGAAASCWSRPWPCTTSPKA